MRRQIKLKTKSGAERHPVKFLNLLYNNCAFLNFDMQSAGNLKQNFPVLPALLKTILNNLPTKTQGRSILQTTNL